ncbi:MAG: efflux RND transporter periplasmic adaptor subunit [Terriglobales bacterium]|jgi:putative peptide zinc metalloprotease protein
MNIANALNAALPELPERIVKNTVPKLDPRVIAKQQLEKGQPIVLAKLPGADNFIRLDPSQWALLQLFDGERPYAEISQQVMAQTGVFYSEEAAREFAAFIQANTDLFYRSPLERNITLHEQLRAQRTSRKRSKAIDFSDIVIAEWPHADDYIARIYPSLRWVYTWWFTLAALVMFALMAYMWAGRFGEIWIDSFQFYNFTEKSGRDLLEFWFLFGAMAFFHESFHGLTCKHFGGAVEKMGFNLMYFAPSFFCDVTQIWIYGGKWERIATVAAGIWGDLIICFAATSVWWATPPGMFAHNLAYKIMMVTGIGVSLLNLNPLIKLDGYYIFSELIEEQDFHERAAAYLSGWTRKHIFGLPAEYEYVPRWHRPFYLIYALLSAMYGYVLLSFLMGFTYNVLHSYSPAWAFIPAGLMGYWVFKDRIHALGRFSKLLYLDKKERVWAWLKAWRMAALGAAVLLLLFPTIWPDFQEASFVLEPVRQASVHAAVSGKVSGVFVEEGQKVVAGQPLVSLENLDLQSNMAKLQADLRQASGRATQNQLRYGDYGSAERERQRLLQEERVLTEETSRLQVKSPISGTVTTPRLHDLAGADLDEGAPLMDLVDDSTLRARVYIPEFAMHDVGVGSIVRLRAPSRLRPISGALRSISPDWVPLDPSLGRKEQLAGVNPPRFFAAEASLDSAAGLRPGMTGTAKIRVGSRSLASFAWRFGRDLVKRRLW